MNSDNHTEAIAHVRLESDGTQVAHFVLEHLLATAQGARDRAVRIGITGLAEYAYVAGLWHDLGKFSLPFQERIRILTGYEVENWHLEGKGAGQVNHSSAGGIFALEKAAENTKSGAIFIAATILSHHTGLQNFSDTQLRLREKQHLDSVAEFLNNRFPEQLDIPLPEAKLPPIRDSALLVRMLFSTLVDADRSDTAAFMRPGISQPSLPKLETLNKKLDARMERLANSAEPTMVNRLRKKILETVNAHIALEPGFFRLAVPTGGGKTLTSLSFALKHALKHGKRRIIYTIPFTSIIEQTAQVFRDALGDDAVLEHHSNIDPDDFTRENARTRLLQENWDAPLIVTTNVLFFESLFANNTSRCRKLHNIANSVIILDEAQTIPAEFLRPILDSLRELVESYGVSIVLCTATQPAFDKRDLAADNLAIKGFENVRSLAPDPEELHKELKRVRVHIPADLHPPAGDADSAWQSIATEIQRHEQVLTIVNTRADAYRLASLIPGCLHLSTFMCPAHRLNVFNEIRALLNKKKPIRVVSTQLVEAGVDLDFPVVYRALAGLDSLAQAAGRCNREGKLDRGDVFVFVPPGKLPAGHLRQSQEIGRKLLAANRSDPFAPEHFRSYFRQLFWTKGDAGLDKYEITGKSRELQFKKIADVFRFIEENQTPVVVPYGGPD
ncbi:MAG: CRISPR-associated helicase Cas3', partial [Leptospiraceae bacterium]|nr:CRISPR-associated helicase Cas3' [Leptospiraceae bacterium]